MTSKRLYIECKGITQIFVLRLQIWIKQREVVLRVKSSIHFSLIYFAWYFIHNFSFRFAGVDKGKGESISTSKSFPTMLNIEGKVILSISFRVRKCTGIKYLYIILKNLGNFRIKGRAARVPIIFPIKSALFLLPRYSSTNQSSEGKEIWETSFLSVLNALWERRLKNYIPHFPQKHFSSRLDIIYWYPSSPGY